MRTDTAASAIGGQEPSGARLLRFSAITVPLYAAAMPAAVYLPAIFARDFGISLGMIGAIFLAGQILNAVFDPLAGLLSDRTRTRFGRRKPWIFAGGILFTAGSALLFFPPSTVSPAYLAIALPLFYLGWSALYTPFLAWSGEISGEYHQRTRIATYQTVVTSAALFASLVLPTIADQLSPSDGRLQLTLMGGLVAVSAIPALLLTLGAFREPPLPRTVEPLSLRQSVHSVFSNVLLLRVLASDVAVRTGQGVRGALFVFFVGYYMQRPEWAAGLFLFQYLFGILAGPIWLRIGLAIGKHRAAIAGEGLQVLINLSLLLVTPSGFGFLLLLTFLQGLAQGSGNLMLRAIVADIADKHRLETGEERAGLYFSVFSLSEKAGAAIAIGIALPLVAWFGFDPKAINGPQALNGLLLVFALGPAIAHAISAALVARFPLDAAAHSEIRRQLDAGQTVLAPAE